MKGQIWIAARACHTYYCCANLLCDNASNHNSCRVSLEADVYLL